MKIIIYPEDFNTRPGTVAALLVLDAPGKETMVGVDGVNLPLVEILIGKISQEEVMALPRGTVVKRVGVAMTWGE